MTNDELTARRLELSGIKRKQIEWYLEARKRGFKGNEDVKKARKIIKKSLNYEVVIVGREGH